MFFADTYFLPTLHMNDREAVGLIAQELDVEQINKNLESSVGPVVSFALEDLTVPALFEAQEQERPESTALVFESGSMGCGELDRVSNRLARHLMGHGVVADQVVGILLDRTPDWRSC